MQAGFIISLVFAIIVAVFALRNGNNVNIDFLFAKVQVSQAIVIFVSAALGAIIVTVLGLVRHVKLSIKIKEQNKQISCLENEKQLLENKVEDMITKETVNNDKIIDEDNEKKVEQEKNPDVSENDKFIGIE
ncbi:LapA family protein [Proteiniborus sp.]|uniref:LapA family protein n=1 Tax=Proteiniborus sp. TaxID=2079015 RepID=UPI003318A017